MTTEHIQHQIDITVLSPLHIGNGKQLSPVGEFFTTQGKVYFLDNDKLIQKIEEEGKRDEYIEKILKEGIDLDFYSVLKEWGIDSTQFADRTVNLNQLGLLSSHNNILHQCIKTNRKAYIPGSSLKGLFRTVMIFDFFTEFSQLLQQLENEVNSILNKKEDKKKNPSRWKRKKKKELNKLWTKTEKQLFPDFLFHILRISDTHTVGDENLVVEQMSRLPFYESDGLGVDWLEECIGTDACLTTTLSIYPDIEDKTISFYFRKNRINQKEFYIQDWKYLEEADIAFIFKIINEYSQKLIGMEMELLRKTKSNITVRDQLIKTLESYQEEINQSDDKFAIARMGSGKTLFFQTILPLLKNETRDKVIDLFTNDEESVGFPRTRVLSVADNQMLGWIKLSYN